VRPTEIPEIRLGTGNGIPVKPAVRACMCYPALRTGQIQAREERERNARRPEKYDPAAGRWVRRLRPLGGDSLL